MKKHLGRLLPVILVLSLWLSVGAQAASVDDMTDVEGHWARDAIAQVMEEGLFQGTSDTAFSPDEPMTRGMFVTVLGRMAGINPWDYQNWYLSLLYNDVDPYSYYAVYINWATRCGIVSGPGDGTFLPDEPMTREQMAAMVVRYASAFGFSIEPVKDQVTDEFVDEWMISDYAWGAVDQLRWAGILSGERWDDGYYFHPDSWATRAECAQILTLLERSLEPHGMTEPEAIQVSPDYCQLRVGDYFDLTATIFPDYANQTVTWISTDPGVVMALPGGTLYARSPGTAEIYAYTSNGIGGSRGGYVYVEVKAASQGSLAYEGESFEDKCMRIFGYVVPGGQYGGQWRDVYRSYATGDTSYLTDVYVQVWDFTDSSHTQKYTKTISITVHKNIADTVEAIFAEIYQSPERPVISYAGGYYASEGSEHDVGLAIDLNADANYYCSPNGTALVGSHWDPVNDPYSIPIDGVIENTFRKYGFTRGIYWRNGYKDYMHFSFFGY